MDYINAAQAAEKWGVTKRRVTSLCKNGQVPGAELLGKMWLIPKTAEKPTDGRITSSNYVDWRKGKSSHASKDTTNLTERRANKTRTQQSEIKRTEE